MKILAKIKSIFLPEESIYQKISKSCLYVLAFLIPFFVLPFSQDWLEISKTILLYFLVLVASLSYLLHVIVKKEYWLIKSKINLWILVFGLFYILSTIFSLNWRVSLIGLTGYYNDSLISFIILLSLYFVTINVIREKKDFLKLFYCLLGSTGFVLLFSLLQIFDLHIFSRAITQVSEFNLVANSISVLAIWLALIVPIALSLIFYHRQLRIRLILGLLALCSFLGLLVLDSYVGWFTLVIGLFLFLIFISWHSKSISTVWVILPTVLVVIAVLMIFVEVNDFTKLNIQDDIVLGQGNSWQVAGSVIKSRFLFGSGPNTFHYDLSLHRPLSFNNHFFWNLSFIKASSQWVQFIATAGLLNFLVILIIIYHFLSKGLKKLFQQSIDFDWLINAVILIVFVSLFLAGFIYSYNIVLSYLFWLFLGLGTIRWLISGQTKVSLQKDQKKNLLFSVGFGIWSVVAVVILVFGIRFYLADHYAVKAQQAVNNLDEIQTVQRYFKKATTLNPLSPENYFNLSESYLIEVGLKIQQGENDIDDLIRLAAYNANKAVKLENESVRSLLRKAVIYRDFHQLVEDTEDVVFSNFDQAKLKSPNDPFVHYESAISYLVYAEALFDQENQSGTILDYLSKAETDLQKAIGLIDGLVEARYLLVQVYDWRGQLVAEAEREILKGKIVNQLETILLHDPQNTEILQLLNQIKEEASEASSDAE